MESLKEFQVTQSTITELLTESMKQKNQNFAKAAADSIQILVKDFHYEDLSSKVLQFILNNHSQIPKNYLFTLSISLVDFLKRDWSCFYRHMGQGIQIQSNALTNETLHQNFLAYLEDYFQYECESFTRFLSNLEILFPDARISVRYMKETIPSDTLLMSCGSLEGPQLAIYIELFTNREACLDFCINK